MVWSSSVRDPKESFKTLVEITIIFIHGTWLLFTWNYLFHSFEENEKNIFFVTYLQVYQKLEYDFHLRKIKILLNHFFKSKSFKSEWCKIKFKNHEFEFQNHPHLWWWTSLIIFVMDYLTVTTFSCWRIVLHWNQNTSCKILHRASQNCTEPFFLSYE